MYDKHFLSARDRCSFCRFDIQDENDTATERQPFLAKSGTSSQGNVFVSSSPKMSSKSQKGSFMKTIAAGKNMLANARRDSNSSVKQHVSG